MANIDYEGMLSAAAISAPCPPPEPERGVISLAGAEPDPMILPVAEYCGCAVALGRDGMRALGWADAGGYPPLVECLSGMMSEGRDAPFRLAVTSGATQAVWLTAAALLDRGDAVVMGGPISPSAEAVFRAHGAEVIRARFDDEGLAELPGVIETARDDGFNVKAVHVMPNFADPTGREMPDAARAALLDIAERAGLVVIEDDRYGMLRYDGEPSRSLFAADGFGRVIYAGSLSAAIGSGLRLGWVAGPSELVERMTAIKALADSGSSAVAQAMAADYCRSSEFKKVTSRVISRYAAKRDVMAEALAASLPSTAEYEVPRGGVFFWVRVPGVDCEAALQRARSAGADYVPGTRFGVSAEHMRLSFSRAGAADIAAAVDSIASALR